MLLRRPAELSKLQDANPSRIKRCAIKQIMRLEHEAGPHDKSDSVPDPLVTGPDIFTVLIAWMMMHGASVPEHDVGVRDRLRRRDIGGQITGTHLRGVVEGDPEIVHSKWLLVLGQSSSGQGDELVHRLVPFAVLQELVSNIERVEVSGVPKRAFFIGDERLG